MRFLKQSKHFFSKNRCLVEKLERETDTFRTNHYSTTRLDIPIYSNLSVKAYKSHNVVTPMTRSNTRSLDATLLRRLHIAAFTLFLLLFSLKSTAATVLAMPSLELTLTDLQDQAVIRRVLRPAELGFKKDTLESGAEVSASLPISVKTSGSMERISGYRLLAFYP